MHSVSAWSPDRAGGRARASTVAVSSGRGRPHSRASRKGRFWTIRHRVVAAVAGAASVPTLSAAAAGRTGSATGSALQG